MANALAGSVIIVWALQDALEYYSALLKGSVRYADALVHASGLSFGNARGVPTESAAERIFVADAILTKGNRAACITVRRAAILSRRIGITTGIFESAELLRAGVEVDSRFLAALGA